MSEQQLPSVQAKHDISQLRKTFDDGLDKKVPVLPRSYKKDSNNKAHPFATTAAKTESLTSSSFLTRTAADKKLPPSRALIPPLSSAVKNGNVSPSKPVASMISNWESKKMVKEQSFDKPYNSSGNMAKPSIDKSHNNAAVNSCGNVAQMAGKFSQLTPSDSLKIKWKHESVTSNDGDYICNWVPSCGISPHYENVAVNKSKPTFVVSDQLSSDETSSLLEGSNAYEIVNYQPTTAQSVRPNPPNRKPMIASSTTETSKLTRSYVNVEIPSDPEPLPPPIPLKKKRALLKTAIINDQSDDSELDEEEGNESQYENWSFLNAYEGDQNMTISELDAYIKSRKLQGLKAEYFKIRNKPDPSEMKICK